MNKKVKAFQCSKCKQLQENDIDDTVFCSCGIDPRPNKRYKGDKELCQQCYDPLDDEPWHSLFYWER